jgi:hypothetical protein
MNVIPITQQLSLVEAKLKRFEIATPRIEAVIEMQNRVGIRGLGMAQSYVTRARIAIWARDAAAAKHFTALAAAEPGGDRLLAIAVNDEPLVAEARRAGVELTLQPSAFEVSVLGSTPAAQSNPQAVRLRETLLGCPDAATRSARALELLCELADGDSGQLYLVGEHDTLTLAAASPGASPKPAAIQFARGFFAQQIDDDEFTAGLTHATQMLSLPGAASYIDDRGRESRLFMLTCKERGALVYVGLAVLTVKNKARLDVQLAAHIAVLASCLLRSGATFGVRASELRVADG